MSEPRYTFGQNYNNPVTPTDDYKHHLVEIIASLQSLVEVEGGGGALTDTQLRATPVPVSLGTDSDVIGKVGIDQTTPGTTNGVVINPIAPVTQTLASASNGAAVDISRVSVLTVQITAYTGDGLMRGQVSNDGTTWYTLNYYRDADGLVAQNIAGVGLFTFAVPGHNYFRLTMVSWGSGSTTAIFNGGQGTAEGIPVNARSLMTAGNASTSAGGFMTAFDGTQVATAVVGYTWNGSTNERLNGNQSVTLLANGPRSTTQVSADLTNHNGRELEVILDMTDAAASPDVTVKIEGKAASGAYYTILEGGNIVTTSTNRYVVFPGADAVANAVANAMVPRTFRITVTANTANSGTYSLDYNLNV